MKVTKKNPFFAFICSGCKSELKAKPKDVQLSPAWEGSYCGGSAYYFVECPVCGEQEMFPNERVTHKVSRAVRDHEQG